MAENGRSEDGRRTGAAEAVTNGTLEWVHQLASGVSRLMPAFRVPEVFRVLTEISLQLSKALNELPKKLQDALRDSGRSVHPELSLDAIRRIDLEYQKGGVNAAAAEVDRLHEALLASAEFREEAEPRWAHSKRAPMFAQLLQAHDQEMYFLTVPSALSLAEGLVVELTKHQGKVNGHQLRQLIEKLVKDDDLLGPLATVFSTRLLQGGFAHGDPVPYFNRHAIMHGADTEYATKQNSVQAIVWVDYLMGLHAEKETECSPPVDDHADCTRS